MTVAPSLPRALGEYLMSIAGRAFDWRGHCCAHFAGGWVRWATARDPLDGLPGCTSPRAWARVVRRAGGIEAMVSRALGCQPVAPAYAHLGDVVLLPGAITGGTLGVCAGRTAVCLGDGTATHHVPMAEATAAWRLAEVLA